MKKEIKKKLEERRDQIWIYIWGEDIFKTLLENKTEDDLKKEIKNVKNDLNCYIEAIEKIESML